MRRGLAEVAGETPGCSPEGEEGNQETGPGWNWAATWVLLSQLEGTEGQCLLEQALGTASPEAVGWEGAGSG